MRPALILALVLTALPVLAAEPPTPPPADETASEGPPTPPPETWVVEGYKAVGYQWVKQPDHCLTTTDLKQAGDYEAEIMRFQDWFAASNLPVACTPAPDSWERPTAMQPPPKPPRPTFTVWAFHLIDGKWVKDEKYCWTTGDTYTCRIDALAYAAKVNAVPGWRATTNAPEAMYAHVNDAVVLHGPPEWTIRFSWGSVRQVYENDDSGFIGYSRGGYPMYSEYGGRTIYRPYITIRTGMDAAVHMNNNDDWVQRQDEADRRQNEINQMNLDAINQMNQALQNVTPP